MRRLLPGLLLALYGVAFAFRAFGGGVPAFDDHPGQLFRLWHALERSLPDGRWTADWNPDWWAGYPELQFYPPGFVLAGAAIRLLSLWQLSVDHVYQLLCGLVLLLPALGTWRLLRRVTEDPWLALAPAVVALTLSAGLRGGIEESLRWGMLTSRLALGLLPLLVLSLRPWVESGQRPAGTPAVLAALVLAHPASVPVAAGVLAAATLLGAMLRPARPVLLEALAAGGLALALAAFWLLPLAVRSDWLVPLAWGESDLGRVLAEPFGRPVLLAVAAAAVLAWPVALARRRPFDVLVAALPLVLLGVVAADAAAFRRGLSAVEPERLTDGLALVTVWAAGLGVGGVVARLTARRPGGLGRPVTALVTVAVVMLAAGSRRSEPTLTPWPTARAQAWPRLDEVSRAHRLDELWTALRGTDRALFLTSSLRLDRDPAWYAPHSHVLGLAPRLADREIVNGTYTHPAPLAARFYAGTAAAPRRIGTLVERLDGQRLLGQPLDRLTPEAFEGFARRLRIATVVVPAAAAERVPFLRDRYAPARTAAGFVLFERKDRPWPRVERITHRRLRVLVPPTGGVWVPTGIAAYPLWQAKSSHGALPTRTDAWGLLEFQVPIDVFEAELVYAEGALEWGGLALTAVGLVAWPVWAVRGRGRPARRAPPVDRRRRKPA